LFFFKKKGTIIGAGSQSWNLRDTHMTQILEYLMKF